MMKLGIVIPLKSKKISKNWQITSDALAATLNSVKNQRLKNYKTVVVGHEIPNDFTNIYPDVIFVTVDFPVPDRSSPDFSHKDLINDKNLKVIKGLQTLAGNEIDYWFPLDSDDVLSTDFTQQLEDIEEGVAGALIQGGYILYQEQNRAIPTQEMVTYCGSTSIISNQFVQIPKTLSVDNMTGSPWSRYAHMSMADFFTKELKLPYKVISQPVLGYVLGSGDNISDRWRDNPWKNIKAYIKPYLKGKRIDKQIQQLFSLTK